MPHFVRVFCRSQRIPDLNELRAVLGEHTSKFSLVPVTPDDPWRRVELTYARKRPPIVFQINRCDDTDSLGIEERSEFLKAIEACESSSQPAIADHIANARYIFCSEAADDLDDDGDELSSTILLHLQRHYEGLVQADGAGFFEGMEVAMELESSLLIRSRALAGYKRNPKHGMTIELSAPVNVQDCSAPNFAFNNGSPYIEVNDPLSLAKLDKVADTSGVLSEYLHEDDLPRALRGQVSYGLLSLRFDASLKKLFVQTIYDCSRELTRDELQELIEYTRGQWSDGAGSGIHQGCARDFDMAPELLVDRKLVRVVTRRKDDITAG